MLECLKEIIGVTQSDCECIIDGLTTNQVLILKQSTSGRYMDDLPGGVHLKALTRMDSCKSMYEMAISARDNAIKTVEDDLIIAMNTKYKKNKSSFTGQIGKMSYAQSLPVLNPWQGLQITPLEYGDTLIKVTKLQLVLSQSGPVTVKLFRAPVNTVMTEEIGMWNVNAVGNSYTMINLTGPIQLPAVVNGVLMEYYFAYDLTGTTAAPKDTTIICLPCNGGISGYGDFIRATGVQFGSPETLNYLNRDTYSHGFILDVDIRCDTNSFFCKAYKDDDAVAVSIAYATWYKSGELLIEDVLKQTDITRYTLLNKEYLWGKRNHFRKEYGDRLTYISQVLDPANTNCYICRETVNQPFMSNILL